MKCGLLLIFICFLNSCAQENPAFPAREDTPLVQTLVDVKYVDYISECDTGGAIITMGIDSNTSSTLNEDEIAKEVIVCSGKDGKDGTDGEDALQPIISIIRSNNIIACEGNSGILISYGLDYDLDSILNIEEITDTAYICDGLDAPETLSIAEVIDPCGDGPGEDEVLIVFSDKSVLAYFETAKSGILSLLEENKTYITTDQQRCKFHIIDGEIISYEK